MWILVPALIVLATVAAMEAVAYLAHRHVMHGFGWGWHRSHHEPGDGPFELNDLYALIFALLAVALFAVGAHWWPPLFYVAIGVTIYGALYFIVHDGLVHQRWPFRRQPRNAYLKRLVQAHRLHHAVEGREGCVSFGFLYAPPVRALKAELDRQGTLARADRRPCRPDGEAISAAASREPDHEAGGRAAGPPGR